MPAKQEKKDETSVNLQKRKDKQKAALDKLKKLSALEKIKQDVSKEDQKKSHPSAPSKGRSLSAGTKLGGLDKLQSDSYLAQLDVRVKSHWTLPQWLIDKPFKARVLVRLDASGRVLFKAISVSSGNATYDEYALASIEKSSPFPPPPDKFVEIYRVDGITFAFPD